jgi:hypothetical protein
VLNVCGTVFNEKFCFGRKNLVRRDLPDEITAVKKSYLSEFPWTLAIIAVRYQIETAKSFTRMWTEINLNQQRGTSALCRRTQKVQNVMSFDHLSLKTLL